MDFDEIQERLDSAFRGCELDRTNPFNDRRHLVVTCTGSEAELEAALSALLMDDDLWYIDRSKERGRAMRVWLSIYSKTASGGTRTDGDR